MRLARVIFSYLLIVSVLVSGCSEEGQGDTPIAQVGDAVLTRTQLIAALPAIASPSDSAVFADQIIRRWVYRQVLLQKASKYLSSETDDIDAAVEEYRSSLIIETYQNKLVEQKFHPQITNDDIQAYYDKMKESFILTDAIVKGCYAVIPSQAPGLKEFLKALSQFNDESSLKVEEYMFHNASKYQSSFDAWLSLSEVRSFLPAGMLPADVRSVAKMPYLMEERDGNVYVLKVLHIMPAGEVAPVEFVRKNISDILVSKRKLEFLDKANRDIYDQATKAGSIKYFDNK